MLISLDKKKKPNPQDLQRSEEFTQKFEEIKEFTCDLQCWISIGNHHKINLIEGGSFF